MRWLYPSNVKWIYRTIIFFVLKQSLKENCFWLFISLSISVKQRTIKFEKLQLMRQSEMQLDLKSSCIQHNPKDKPLQYGYISLKWLLHKLKYVFILNYH